MKKLTLVSTIFIIIISFLILNLTLGKESAKLISPATEDKILGVNLWLPKFASAGENSALEVTADAAFFIESKKGEVLYSKNANKRLPIASLVKVMTVLVALEHKSMDDKFVVSKRAAEMEPDKMLLIPGEKLTLKELLYGVFLISANDAAEVLADRVMGERKDFIKLMNDKSQQLGMENSYFANPTGLDEDNNNSYSTAYDLAILARFLIRNYPQVVEISQTPHVYFPVTSEHQDYEMYSGINLLTTYPGVVGFKTGYTPEAGLTLITLARKNGHEVIGVLLGSESRRDEAKELLDYSFQKLGVQ